MAMNKNDRMLLILAVLLAAAMLLTFLFGGERSRHGVGGLDSKQPVSAHNHA